MTTAQRCEAFINYGSSKWFKMLSTTMTKRQEDKTSNTKATSHITKQFSESLAKTIPLGSYGFAGFFSLDLSCGFTGSISGSLDASATLTWAASNVKFQPITLASKGSLKLYISASARLLLIRGGVKIGATVIS